MFIRTINKFDKDLYYLLVNPRFANTRNNNALLWIIQAYPLVVIAMIINSMNKGQTLYRNCKITCNS